MPKKKPLAEMAELLTPSLVFTKKPGEIQEYGTVTHALPLELEEPVRLEMTEKLNQLLADTMTLRDLYKKSHWQVAGPTFYQLHLLFDKHYGEQAELVIPLRNASSSGRRESGHGSRCCGDHPDRASAARPGRSPGANLPPVGRPQNHYWAMPGVSRACRQTGRRGHQRPCGQRCLAD